MPVPASHAVTSELEAVQHSIRKWRGLTEESLKKHDVTRAELPTPSNANCSLCLRHSNCATCSLYMSRGNVPCDEESDDDDEKQSPFHAYYNNRLGYKPNPLPMIKALEQTERDIIKGKLDL